MRARASPPAGRPPLTARAAVLGVPHPAVATRDVALYQPFRNTLRASGVVGLQTLMWNLMRRRVQEGKIDPVRPAPSRCFLR